MSLQADIITRTVKHKHVIDQIHIIAIVTLLSWSAYITSSLIIEMFSIIKSMLVDITVLFPVLSELALVVIQQIKALKGCANNRI